MRRSGDCSVSQPPDRPQIYHITHLDNLSGIVSEGAILSDAIMIANGGLAISIGMSNIKTRRLNLPVTCHSGDHVGEYAPFNFCPRSIMLYVIYRANHPQLTYRGGQGPILHLEADLMEATEWADANGRRWAITTSNAGAAYTDFSSRIEDLHQIDWTSVAATDFRATTVQEAKQAEFLMHESFPWELVSRIGVLSVSVQAKVQAILATGTHQPSVEIKKPWYF